MGHLSPSSSYLCLHYLIQKAVFQQTGGHNSSEWLEKFPERDLNGFNEQFSVDDIRILKINRTEDPIPGLHCEQDYIQHL